MPPLIGISFYPPLKQHLLLFDKIVSPFAEVMIKADDEDDDDRYPDLRSYAADMKWLQQQRILMPDPGWRGAYPMPLRRAMKEWSAALHRIVRYSVRMRGCRNPHNDHIATRLTRCPADSLPSSARHGE